MTPASFLKRPLPIDPWPNAAVQVQVDGAWIDAPLDIRIKCGNAIGAFDCSPFEDCRYAESAFGMEDAQLSLELTPEQYRRHMVVVLAAPKVRRPQDHHVARAIRTAPRKRAKP